MSAESLREQVIKNIIERHKSVLNEQTLTTSSDAFTKIGGTKTGGGSEGGKDGIAGLEADTGIKVNPAMMRLSPTQQDFLRKVQPKQRQQISPQEMAGWQEWLQELWKWLEKQRQKNPQKLPYPRQGQ